MSVVRRVIDSSSLSDRCRVDLHGIADALEAHCATLPKRGPTADAPRLPACTFAATASSERKRRCGQDAAAVTAFYTEKEKSAEKEKEKEKEEEKGEEKEKEKEEKEKSAYFRPLGSAFPGAAAEPFRRRRDRRQLSGGERDFVRRYAEAAARTNIEREEDSAPDAQTAAEAYRRAFAEYRGRDPTAREMAEADRLFFAFTEDGSVGVVQKPHFYGPHAHVSICNRRPTRCANQVYRPELPPVRAARDRFPGPIPVWSSTKNLHAMVASDVHVPGLHNVTTRRNPDIKLKSTVGKEKGVSK